MAPVAAVTTAALWVCLWVSTPMTTSAESASMGIAVAPCPEDDVVGAGPDEARQDGDGTRPLASGGQAPPSGQQLRLGRRRQPRVDKSSAGHPTGSVILRVTPAATSSSPGSSPNRWAVSQSFSWSFHQALVSPTEAQWLDDPTDPTCKDGTRRHALDDPRPSCKQQVGGPCSDCLAASAEHVAVDRGAADSPRYGSPGRRPSDLLRASKWQPTAVRTGVSAGRCEPSGA
jgi:hypothetical protein